MIACRQSRAVRVKLQVPRLPPDFLSGLVVSVNVMRLSSKKAAYVVVFETGVVGPESAPNDVVGSLPKFSAAPTSLPRQAEADGMTSLRLVPNLEIC